MKYPNLNTEHLQIKVLKEQINRVITVKSNLLKRSKSSIYHPTERALNFIIDYDSGWHNDDVHICHSSESMIFSAMQEGSSL